MRLSQYQFRNTLKMFQKMIKKIKRKQQKKKNPQLWQARSGRTRSENTQRSRKCDKDTAPARLKVRLSQGAIQANTSLMAIPYPAKIPWLTDSTGTMSTSVFHLVAHMPPLILECLNNKIVSYSQVLTVVLSSRLYA